MFETITLDEPRPNVHRLQLERRPRLNALNEPMIEELVAATELLATQNPGAVVLEGSGKRAFSIGLDTRAPIALTDNATDGEDIARKGQRVMEAIDALQAPVVAAIDGFALGGGLELALAADVRIGGKSSKYGLPEITHGLIPGAGGTQRLPALVGHGRAVEMLFTGNKYDAETMEEWGVLTEIVDDDDVTEAALDRAEQLSKADARATQHVKRLTGPNAWGTTEGYMMERTGLSRAFSLDPFDIARKNDDE